MSFFRKFRPKDKESFLKRERDYDEKKRQDFLKEQAANKEVSDSPQVDNNPSTPRIDSSKTFTGHNKKTSFRERVENFKVKRKFDKEEKELRHLKKVEERERKEESEREAREVKVFGHKLNAQEREANKEKSNKIKLDKEIKQAQRRKAVKEGYATFEKGVKTVNKYRKQVSGYGINFGSGLDFGGGQGKSGENIGNINLDLVNALKPATPKKTPAEEKKVTYNVMLFDQNFGSLLAGKKGKKKLKKHPLSI
jgi:hypothetical protein